MKRRDFLSLTATCLATPKLLLAGGAGSRPFPTGLQLFMIRDALGQAPADALRAVAAMGYREVEMFGMGGNYFVDDPLFGFTPGEFRALLDECGLAMPATAVSGRHDIEQVAPVAHALNIRFLTEAMAPEFQTRTEGGGLHVHGARDVDELRSIAARLNRQGAECREHGFTFAYHNHQMEFEPVAGLEDELPFDFIMRETDPDLVKIQFDVGWLTGAGVDPVAYLKRYGKRVVSLHLKDYDPDRPIGQDLKRTPIPIQTRMVPPGDGVVDFGSILSTADAIGIRHRFVEVDVPDDPMEDARRGLRHIEALEL